VSLHDWSTVGPHVCALSLQRAPRFLVGDGKERPRLLRDNPVFITSLARRPQSSPKHSSAFRFSWPGGQQEPGFVATAQW
jgi:hypothetical protein